MKLSRQSGLKWTALCLLGGLFVFLLYRYHSQLGIQAVKLWNIFRDHHQLKKIIKSVGPYSPLVFILLHILHAIILPIPGEAIEFLGGYVFGAWAGMLYNMIGLTVGSCLAFGIARFFERRLTERFISPEIRKKFAYLIGHEGSILSFLLFLIPGFPKNALCYILGLTPIQWGIFIFISTMGRIPGVLMITLEGAKVYEHQYKTFLILFVITALIILIFYIYRENIDRWIKKMLEAGIQKKSG
jgi:uncharacterized membrane protein YdjX (TVP38/TMEM64 family)